MQWKSPLVVLACLSVFAVACSKEAAAKRYLSRGSEFFKAGNYEEASLNFRKALQNDQRLGEAARQLALSELKQGKIRETYQAFTQAVQLQPDHEQTKADFGDFVLNLYLSDSSRPTQFYELLLQLSEQMLQRNPQSYEALRLKGYLALTDRKSRDAVQFFQKAYSLKAEPRIGVALAQAIMEDNQFPEGERLALSLIDKVKEFGGSYDLLYTYYMRGGQAAQGEQILRRKVVNNPDVPGYVLQLATHFRRLNNTPALRSTLQPLIEDGKKYPNGRLFASDFYRGIGDGDEALRLLQEALPGISNAKDKVPYQKRMVTLLIGLGRAGEASGVVEDILRAEPGDDDSKAMRAVIKLESGKPEGVDAALAELQGLVNKRPDNGSLRYQLGRAFFVKGNLDASTRELTESVRLSPGDMGARVLLVEIALRRQQFKEALQYTSELLAQEPRNSRIRLMRSIALIGSGSWGEARLELNKLIQDDPQFADAQLQLGLLNVNERKFGEADAIFRRFYKPGLGDTRPLEGLVAARVAQRQFDQAIQLLQSEAKDNPNSPTVRGALASTAIRAKKYDLALEQVQQLLTANPNSVDLLVRMGEIYQMQGKQDQAIAQFQKARELAPKTALPTHYLAYSYYLTNRRNDALTNYRASLQMAPDDPLVNNNLAYLLAENGADLDEALKMAQKAQKLMDRPEIADTVGFVYLKKGQADSAVQVFRNLVQKNPQFVMYRVHLAQALMAKGDQQTARAELEKALSSGPSKGEEGMIRELMGRLMVR